MNNTLELTHGSSWNGKKKKRNMLLRIWKLFLWLLLLGIMIIAGLLYIPKFAGIQPMVVLSGSMEPAYPVGSVAYVKEYQEKDHNNRFAKGDVITFPAGGSDALVTHRVVEVDQEQEVYITKGDANDVKDGQPVAFTDVVGYPILHIPMLGYAAVVLSTMRGKAVVIILIVTITILMFLTDGLEGGRKRGKCKSMEQVQIQ